MNNAHEHFAIELSLHQVILRASPNSLQCELLFVGPRQHDDRRGWQGTTKIAVSGQPHPVREGKVEQDKVERTGAELTQCLIEAPDGGQLER